MYSQEIKECVADLLSNKSNMIKGSLNKSLVNIIQNETLFLDSYYTKIPLKIRCIAIEQDLHEIPKCPICNNPVQYDKVYNSNFNQFCSNKCRGISRSNILNELLYNKEFIYRERIINKRSKESIAKELNCSLKQLNKQFKEFNIPEIRYNESSYYTQEKLNDIEWLKQEHKDKHRKLDDIANEIESSKSVLSKILKDNNITANSSNSYNRSYISSSKECLEIRDYIENELGIKCELNNREILEGREIDIFIPDYNIGIEYNGIWCHIHQPNQDSYAKQKGLTYHSSKTNFAKSKGIKLIHIWSDDWKFRKDIWKSRLANLLKKSVNIIYARKCNIIEIPANIKGEFLRVNHLQGNDCASIKLGLYFKNELIGVMTFCNARYNKNIKYELSRFAIKMNTSCPGGFSKLLSYFRKLYSGSIISYADQSYSDGNVYLKNGFILKKVFNNYWYVDLKKETKLHRSAYMKKKIAPNDPRTEVEILKSMSIYKLYGAGMMTWILE